MTIVDGSTESGKSSGGTLCSSPKVCQGTARTACFLGTFHVTGQGVRTGMSQFGRKWVHRWLWLGWTGMWGAGDRPCCGVTMQCHVTIWVPEQ